MGSLPLPLSQAMERHLPQALSPSLSNGPAHPPGSSPCCCSPARLSSPPLLRFSAPQGSRRRQRLPALQASVGQHEVFILSWGLMHGPHPAINCLPLIKSAPISQASADPPSSTTQSLLFPGETKLPVHPRHWDPPYRIAFLCAGVAVRKYLSYI